MQKPRVAAMSRISEYLGRCDILLVLGLRPRVNVGGRGGGLQGGSSPCTDFFLILDKIGTCSEPFFKILCVFPGLELNLKQQFSGHL